MEKRDDNPMNYDSSASMSTGWQFASASVVNSSIQTAPVDVQLPVRRGDLVIASFGPSVSMAEAFGPDPQGHPFSSQSLGFCDINLPNASASSTLRVMSSCLSLRSGNDGIFDMRWNPSSSMLKGGIFLPAAPGMLPQSLTHIPADSGFIERAARFSYFKSGNFNDLANPFRSPESVCPYSRGSFQGRLAVICGSVLNSVSREQALKGFVNVAKASNEASSPISFMAAKGSSLQIERRSEGLVTSLDEGKQCAGWSGNDSVEAEFSGDPDETALSEGNVGDSSAKSIGSMKRRKSGKGKGIQQLSEAAKNTSEIQPKTADQSPTSAADKTTAKQGKQESQASDLPKEEYIHVRVRRGQATNSHSLAERVRREKISERMKFLQDLVPGFSKVTSRALMLDEIIKYVQSLQRQVEFLSMKLATVNPSLDFKLEGLLAKDGKGIQQLGEAAKNASEIQPKTADQSPTSAADKTAAKQGKQESQASDLPKEEYIHVRARRGQATNIHSLAERVRREKISERMKFLQDLVPGCSKVTGKALTLDEIIKYVQSLQRQVEFLSMKLATVNPSLDFNLEGLLVKDGKGIQQLGEAAKNTSEIQPKTTDQSPASAADKTAAKQGKQESQASDLPKEDYIHVRARRGQATNSHSLAERVRREKISERMKFLQDLVPGCSKVTGKALMLDEIIKYVQSLQRQVELATVNPRLVFTREGHLAKDGKGIQQLGEAAKNTSEIQPKTADQSPTSAADKTAEKQGKQESQASDLPKEEYVHVRARRGQATNSHSLAERVRKEKISERMKFLQDLVPGCSKVTGKALMLDEIIKYVQSLQRQVEVWVLRSSL